MSVVEADERAVPVQIGITAGYDKWAATYDRDPNPLIALEESVVLELVGDVRGKQVLDLGCGTGRSDFHPYWIVFDRGHTEFFDDTGQEYYIRCYPHLFEDYWRLCQEFGLRIEDWREPKIDDRLIERFPALARYRGVPLAVIISLQYRS